MINRRQEWHLYKPHENEPQARDMGSGTSNTVGALHSISENDRQSLSGIRAKCWAAAEG